jgi:hypothetical protein
MANSIVVAPGGTISGGYSNVLGFNGILGTATYSVIGGGSSNFATGIGATVAGGIGNAA